MVPVLVLLLFAAAWFLPARLAPDEIYGNGFYYLPPDGMVYGWWKLLGTQPLWVQMLPTLLLLILSALTLIRSDIKHLLMGTRSYGMGYVFLFLVFSAGYLLLFHPAFLASYLMVAGMGFLTDLFKNETRYDRVFAYAFCWSFAALIYPPAALLLPVIIAGLAIMVSAQWRHWAVALTGMLFPALLTGFVLFLTGHLDYELTSYLHWFRLRSSWPPGFITRDPFILVWAGLLMFWILIASLRYRNPKVQSRQLFQINFIHFLCTLIMILGLETVSVESLWLMLIPVTYLMTFWSLEAKRGWVRDLFFLTLLISFVFFRIRGFM